MAAGRLMFREFVCPYISQTRIFSFGRTFRALKSCCARITLARDFSTESVDNLPKMPLSEQPGENDNMSGLNSTTGCLVDYMKEMKKTLSESSKDQENILDAWTKANKKGGVFSDLQNNRSQLLGFTVQQIEARLELLQSIGITGKDALLIALEMPSHLSFTSQSFKAIADLLNNLGCCLAKLIIEAPYIFGVSYSSLETNVKRLQNIGITNEVICKSIESSPLVIIYPISDDAISTMKVLLSSCEFNEVADTNNASDLMRQPIKQEFALRLLLQPFDGATEQAVLSENFKEVAKFLQEIQVSPCHMALNYPAFFEADVERLHEALEFFTSRPLLFETELIQKMMVTKTEVFLPFDKDAFQGCVELLKGIVKTPRQLYLLLQNYFFFQGKEMKFEDNIKILQKYGFQNEKITDILTSKDYFLSREKNLEEKVKVLLSIEGITVDIIAEFSYCLLKPLKLLENRILFAREMKPEILKDINMDYVYGTDDEEFVTLICASTIEKYQELTGEAINSKKFKSNQQRKRKKDV